MSAPRLDCIPPRLHQAPARPPFFSLSFIRNALSLVTKHILRLALFQKLTVSRMTKYTSIQLRIRPRDSRFQNIHYFLLIMLQLISYHVLESMFHLKHSTSSLCFLNKVYQQCLHFRLSHFLSFPTRFSSLIFIVFKSNSIKGDIN